MSNVVMDLTKREQAIEGSYQYDLDLYARCRARAYKNLGLWAAAKMGIINPDEVIEYAMSLVIYEYDEKHSGNATDKIAADFKNKEIMLDKFDIQDKLDELLASAKMEFTGDNETKLL